MVQQLNLHSDRADWFQKAFSKMSGIALAVFLLASPLHSLAASYLLVKSGQGEIYTRFAESLESSLAAIDKTNTLTIITTTNYAAQPGISDSDKYDAIISAGIEASMAVSSINFKKTILMAMVPKESFETLSNSKQIRCNSTNCHVIFLGQPVERQLRLIKLALPNTKQIAVIGSKNSSQLINEISKSASKFGFSVNSSLASDESSVLTALNQNLANADVLMAIPDPVVFNRYTARAILLTAFHQHIPLFAYSNSFVRAGATLGIYSTPENIAEHVASLLSRKHLNPGIQHTMYPKYFTININQRAADALNIAIPDIQYLEAQLKTYEK